MNDSIRARGLGAMVALALALSQTASVLAADPMNSPAMDCSKADGMIMMPGGHNEMAMHAMKSTGDVDKDFAQMMLAQHRKMVAMAQAEMSCGKDAKTKAVAQKQLDQASADSDILHDLLKNDSKI